jgi:hypothetical protein
MSDRCASCRTLLADELPLCERCRPVAASDIAALAVDYGALAGLAPPRGAPAQRVSGTHTPSVPIDLAADALARDIAWRCGAWEPPVREAAGLPPAPERAPMARLVHRASALLSSSLSDFLALGDTWGYPDGIEAGCVARSGLNGVLSLQRLHRQAGWLLGLTAPATHLPGMCRHCGAQALTRPSGTDDVQCRHCRRTATVAEYRVDASLILGRTRFHSTG